MKLVNCSPRDFIKNYRDYRIIFFGAGSWLTTVNYTDLMELEPNFTYVVDNNPWGEVTLGNRSLKVFLPSKLAEESKCVVLITSPVYGYEMYTQLVNMDLPDDVICVSLPFLSIFNDTQKSNSDDFIEKAKKENKTKIPKVIHSFWFSGDEKPDSYKKCVDTWYETLTDYEIKEWNQDNYDCNKNPFLKKAIECRAWAFASDYARLDVLQEHGGIYLDMDVEVFMPFDDLLGNEALLSFSNNFQIDLAVLGSMKNNPLIVQLLHLYENVQIPNTREEFVRFFQPTFVKPTLAQWGIRMNGESQIVKNATVFSHEFFMPQEYVLFFPYEKTTNTYCNHLDNFGWSFSGENKREKKIRENRLLWDEVKK